MKNVEDIRANEVWFGAMRWNEMSGESIEWSIKDEEKQEEKKRLMKTVTGMMDMRILRTWTWNRRLSWEKSAVCSVELEYFCSHQESKEKFSYLNEYLQMKMRNVINYTRKFVLENWYLIEIQKSENFHWLLSFWANRRKDFDWQRNYVQE